MNPIFLIVVVYLSLGVYRAFWYFLLERGKYDNVFEYMAMLVSYSGTWLIHDIREAREIRRQQRGDRS